MSKDKENVPKLRFPGFTDAWEERKLEDMLVQPITDGPHETPDIVDIGIPFISVDAIVDNKIDFTRKRGFITEEYNNLCCKKYKPEYHDVYLVKSGSTVGKTAIVETHKIFNIWSPLAAMRCEGISDPYYLYYLLQTEFLQNQVFHKASHGTQPNLSMRQLEKFDVCITQDIEEQKTIGKHFQNIDNLINLHQRKLNNVQSLKDGLLQKMFPKDGEDFPEVRFPGFTDAWKQHKLGEISKLGSSKRVHREDYAETGIPFFRGSEISKLGSSSKLEDVLYISEEYYKDLKNKYGVPQIGDILITAVGTLGNPYLIRDNAPFYFKDGNLIWISDIQINSQYLNMYLGDGIGKKRVLESAAGSNQKALTMEKLENVSVLFPSKAEQVKISGLFEYLDHLITLHQRKLEHLQQQKKALLQQMFV